MQSNPLDDTELMQLIEYNCKQWCSNFSVKYFPENLSFPVSKEDFDEIAAKKQEGQLLQLEYHGQKLYGYYTAAKVKQESPKPDYSTGNHIEELHGNVDNAPDSGKGQSGIVESDVHTTEVKRKRGRPKKNA